LGSPKTLIFIPTYNERENAGVLFEQLRALPLAADLLFVDDNSPDGTGEMLDELAAQHTCLHVLHRDRKLGIGGAHLEGILWAYEHGYERLVTMDCDFTHSPADVPRLLEQADRFDVVIGSRWLQRNSLADWSAPRRALSNVGHWLTQLLLRMPYDATAALRLYNLSKIPRQLFSKVNSRGYSFFFESLFVLIRNGCRVGEIPITLPNRTYGHSKMSYWEAEHSARRILHLYLSTLLNPEQFCVPEPFTQLNPHLVDPQNWDNYWEKKKRVTSLLYDVIATVYRNLIIKRQLNRVIRKHFPAGSQLLHAGCGSAQVDRDIQKQMQITEVDISLSALELCRQYNPRACRIQQADIMALPFADASFDGAYNLGVLEHFTDAEIQKILRELRRVVKPSGKVVIFWPHARASSVFVLRGVHWVLNSVLKRNMYLYPAEISLLKSREFALSRFEAAGLKVQEYSFGPRDMFVQAVVVAGRAAENGQNRPAGGTDCQQGNA
jgi:dolichol-phosphate mannosyltransferase